MPRDRLETRGAGVGSVDPEDPYEHAPLWLRFAIQSLHDQVDPADPRDPVRAALQRAGLERRPR